MITVFLVWFGWRTKKIIFILESSVELHKKFSFIENSLVNQVFLFIVYLLWSMLKKTEKQIVYRSSIIVLWEKCFRSFHHHHESIACVWLNCINHHLDFCVCCFQWEVKNRHFHQQVVSPSPSSYCHCCWWNILCYSCEFFFVVVTFENFSNSIRFLGIGNKKKLPQFIHSFDRQFFCFFFGKFKSFIH